MGLRPAHCVRSLGKRPWTRFSRKRPRKSFIKAMPHHDLVVFRMGEKKKEHDITIHLRQNDDDGIVLRDNAIESARQAANKYLENKIPSQYYFIVRVYPHNIIRENKMIAGAGADRLQKGMRQSFGRPTDCSARLQKGRDLFSVYTYKQNDGKILTAFKRAMRKLSGKWRIVVEEAKVKAL